MNEMEKFLNFGAIVKLRRDYDDDLFKFIKLMKSVGFLNEYADNFEKNCCYDKNFNEFSESQFWHLVEINGGNKYDICLEFQWGKGFTWGNEKDYINYDNEIKILNIDQLIKVCNKEDIFNMNYEYTNFRAELEDKESASKLDEFLVFYEWALIKYPDGSYNIKDEQCNTFIFDDNVKLENVIDRVYYRMVDYFIDEEDIEGLIKEGEHDYVQKEFNSYMNVGKNLKLLDDEDIKKYINWFEKIRDLKKENEMEDEVEE